jgi:hypothetical protein
VKKERKQWVNITDISTFFSQISNSGLPNFETGKSLIAGVGLCEANWLGFYAASKFSA